MATTQQKDTRATCECTRKVEEDAWRENHQELLQEQEKDLAKWKQKHAQKKNHTGLQEQGHDAGQDKEKQQPPNSDSEVTGPSTMSELIDSIEEDEVENTDP